MTGVRSTVYRPRKAAAQVYARLYELYRILHDAFGVPGSQQNVYRVMKELIAIRDQVRRGR
jgi:L-ribulokinase